MNERIKRIIALEKVMAKTKPLSVEASTKEIAEALIMLYDDPRSPADIANMVSSGCYSPPVHQLESKFEDPRKSGERYRMMCR
ncbi:hypothetical protein SNU60_004501 [Escherichia coli]|jgi:hypothetical protein|nr:MULTISPECIES: hypothetical protein [Enterobacteriaceae]MCL9616047.1 hypothetical protein [Salmonella enterica subsp. enterica serovar Enteritidis]EEU9346047.1 hypothetical protein [Escherichia coli]EEW1511935.1 hypothetical protein [Escherichia coli]EFC5131318.1 hypothetical protein [Escherichia coli]EFE7737277.1 hypothetical protein [Escherichia coli]